MEKLDCERLNKLYDELDIGVMVIAVNGGEILFFNQHVCRNMELDPSDIGDKHYADVFEPDFAALYAKLSLECADDGPHTKIFYWERKMIWEQISARRIVWESEAHAILLNIANVTEVSRSEYEYKQMAYYDRLLRLPNGEKLEEDIRSSPDFDRSVLIHFDLDRFAFINDLYGWEAGDELLRKIRDWLLATLRKSSKLYRTNDDEFCLFIKDISVEAAKERAEEILERFKKPWEISFGKNKVNVYCTLVMGVVYGKHIRGDIRNVLYRTTHASGKKKANYVFYDEEIDAQIQKNVRLHHELINCIKGGMQGFEIYYQPVVAAKSGQWVGAEALCRWKTPAGESVGPGVFMPLVENMGLVGEVDYWVRETSLSQCLSWGLGEKTFFLDMNLSPFQPINEAFIEQFLSMLERIKYPREKLSLEITESTKMEFSENNLKGLRRLRDEGITLALDDFGTGYSTLENLINIPAKALKTERVFIRSLEHDPYFQYLMRIMVDIAHTVDMVLIAEGVETEAQRKLLISYGVDFMQGYLFSRPLSAQQFSRHLHYFSDSSDHMF